MRSVLVLLGAILAIGLILATALLVGQEPSSAPAGSARAEGPAEEAPAPPEAPPLPLAERLTAHWMRQFVAALTAPPDNREPAPDWDPPLREGAEPIGCADCHDPAFAARANASRVTPEEWERLRMPADPHEEAAAPTDPMPPPGLMMRWVARLNRRHGDRLDGVVTCTTCHANDPSGGAGARQLHQLTHAYFMVEWIRALTNQPDGMREPAPDWRPLIDVHDPDARPVLCGTCHEDSALAGLSVLIHDSNLPRPAIAEDRRRVGRLMRRWVDELNRQAGPLLRERVTCTHCHEHEPRYDEEGR